MVAARSSRAGAGRGPAGPAEGANEGARRAARLAVETPLDHFRGMRKKFDAAGLKIYGYNYSFNPSFTRRGDRPRLRDRQGAGRRRHHRLHDAAGGQKVVPFAEKHKMVVAMHDHSNVTDPNEFATPESFAAAMKMSKYFKVNLDIGHFTAANFDAVAYLSEHHADITNLHIKDRKKDQGDNTPWGEGDTPIREVLQLVKKERLADPGGHRVRIQGHAGRRSKR